MDDERRSDDPASNPSQEGDPTGPQAPAGPQSPAGPQPPAPGGPGPQAPFGAPQPPPASPPPGYPQAPPPTAPPPAGYPAQPGAAPPPGQAPPPQPGAVPPPAPAYGGPVPPGGWQQPVAPQPPAYSGQLANWGSRLGAHLLDGLLLLAVLGVAGGLIAGLFAVSDAAGIVGAVLFGLAALVFLFGYAPFLMAREGEHNGQTLGKQVLNIRVIRTDGQKVSGGLAALREIVLKGFAVSIASSIIPIIPWFLNYFWPLWDDENRALHDMAANTRVVMAP